MSLLGFGHAQCRALNPACGISLPLLRSWWLGKKKGKEAFVVPRVIGDPMHASGMRVAFGIGHDPTELPEGDGTVGRRGAQCVSCGTAVSLSYIREQGRARKMAAQLQWASSCQDERPILFHQEGRAGHGVGKPLDKQADDGADVLTFLDGQLRPT